MTAGVHLSLKAAGFAAVVFAVATAGCLDSQDSPPGPAEDAPAEGGQRPATGADNRFLEPMRPETVLASNCTGWEVRQFWPGSEPPAPRLSEWQRSDPWVVSVYMQGFDCDRVSFAGLERGPVQMVFDYADNVAVPEGCAKIERSTDFFGLYSWGLSDEGLAQRLSDLLAAPTYTIEYSHETQSSGPTGSVEKVEWGPPGQPKSNIQVDASQESQRDARFPSRFFWPNATGVIALDLAYEGEMNDLGDRTVHGTLEPPMVLAEAYPNGFVGSSEWLRNETLVGTIYSWADLACKQPSGS